MTDATSTQAPLSSISNSSGQARLWRLLDLGERERDPHNYAKGYTVLCSYYSTHLPRTTCNDATRRGSPLAHQMRKDCPACLITQILRL